MVPRRVCGTVVWALADHLGSTSVTANEGGDKRSELRYKAWGETRYVDADTPTSYRYTGQQEEAAIGLYYYVARWYDPALGRFIQADTIVPSPGNPQSLNRYSYVLNNPLRYVDPTGHVSAGKEADDAEGLVRQVWDTFGIPIQKDWGWNDQGEWDAGLWTYQQLESVRRALYALASVAGGERNVLTMAGGSLTILRGGGWYFNEATANWAERTITIWNLAVIPIPGVSPARPLEMTVIHEVGHFWVWESGGMLAALVDAATKGEQRPSERAYLDRSEHFCETLAYSLWEPGSLYPQHKGFLGLALQVSPSEARHLLADYRGLGPVSPAWAQRMYRHDQADLRGIQ